MPNEIITVAGAGITAVDKDLINTNDNGKIRSDHSMTLNKLPEQKASHRAWYLN